jgi:hypothetical protein
MKTMSMYLRLSCYTEGFFFFFETWIFHYSEIVGHQNRIQLGILRESSGVDATEEDKAIPAAFSYDHSNGDCSSVCCTCRALEILFLCKPQVKDGF